MCNRAALLDIAYFWPNCYHRKGRGRLRCRQPPHSVETLQLNIIRVWGKNITFFTHISLTPCSTSCLNTRSECTGHINKKTVPCSPLSVPGRIAREDPSATVPTTHHREKASHQKRTWRRLSPGAQRSPGLSNTYRDDG